MGKRVIPLLAVLVAGFVAGHLTAARRAERELDGIAFVHAVEGASLAANSLLLIERGEEGLLGNLYRSRMRDDVGRAERLIETVERVDFPIPNLVDGVVKAEGLCRTDSELATLATSARRVHDHLAALHARALQEAASRGD